MAEERTREQELHDQIMTLYGRKIELGTTPPGMRVGLDKNQLLLDHCAQEVLKSSHEYTIYEEDGEWKVQIGAEK